MQRKKYTAKDQALLVKKFKESNLEKENFCKLNGISYSSLNRWLKNNDRKKPTNNFTPITIQPRIINHQTMPGISSTRISNATTLKIKLPNGVEIEIPETYNMANMAKCVNFLKEV